MPKTFSLLLAISCISFISYGQIKKGSILIGGQVSYYNSKIAHSTNQRDQKYSSAAFNISVGEAFKENSVFGLSVTYNPSSYDYTANSITYSTSKLKFYSIGGYYRLYKKLAKDLYFFSELGASYIFSKQTDTDTLGIKLSRVNSSGGQLSFTPGISYKIFKRVNLEITIPNIAYAQYSVSKNETFNPSQSSKEGRFYLNTSLNSSPLDYLGVGFRIIL